ncbi:hypothetical protein [Micromonospora sp. WMMA1976]|uniref:hypothetical protein n=1 Tax=Micromonospora sp. WMMA1976 TaxID=3014995 RepID=UPI00248D02F1|nr:hypothetical protein [Micromonospora sp. WMMA1976]WBC03653.1 hypothetical protein O7546_01365 [Micromonospora sp. WMMA1976]
MDPRKLAEFVDAGGCLYVSDLAGDLLALAFPELFVFDGRGGRTGEMDALVVDRGLREMSGRMIRIRFDMGSWKVLRHCQGHAVIRSAAPGEYADLPIMVSVRCGRGTVFYTCFHNRSQQFTYPDFGEKRGRYFLARDGAVVPEVLSAIATSVIGSALSTGSGKPQYLPPRRTPSAA